MGVNYADALSYVVTGPAEEAAVWVGREVTSRSPFAVNEAQIAYFCALIEDADENYWDTEAATTRYGARISPPGMLMVWAFPLPWNPRRKPEHAPVLALEVPLPGTTLINVSTDSRFSPRCGSGTGSSPPSGWNRSRQRNEPHWVSGTS